MAERLQPARYLLTNFLKEGTGISPEMRQKASGLSIELARFALFSPTLPLTQEDKTRIDRVHGIVHFAGKDEYEGMVQKYMEEAEKKCLPTDPLLDAALARGSAYLTQDNIHESTGLTIFPTGSDHATAAIIRKPEGPITEQVFLNLLTEEMVHASAPQATFLRTMQRMFPFIELSPLDFFELVGRWVKFDFLEQYNPSLILPEEQILVHEKKRYQSQGLNTTAFSNLYLRGICKT